ncbi:NAD(P)-binding domain-containing protein [Streptomyces violaceusniger]|uniref:6-phosphogluconate dehydrogenase NADP-binding domain-containing protein n=1 Tax=Streptomyces violaceusniger TaxID=68280 RepID=A0A4D4KLY9_STRVO|nr:hypothetical protein SVIO_005580 [Streptomyces violaceusniger]
MAQAIDAQTFSDIVSGRRGSVIHAVESAKVSCVNTDRSSLVAADRAAATRKLAGIRTVDDVGHLAGTPYAVLSLPSADVVETTVPVLLSRPGTLAIVDTTTSEPATSASLSSLAADQGAAFVDAPVSGGRDGAAEGRLTAFVGATEQAFDTARPVLEALTGGQYQHLGGPGSGNVVKLLNNVLAAANLVSVVDLEHPGRGGGGIVGPSARTSDTWLR